MTRPTPNGLYSADLYAGETVLIAGRGAWTDGLAETFQGRGALVLNPILDVSDPAAIAEVFDVAEASGSPISILITAPPKRRLAAAADMRLAGWRAVTGQGYDGVFFCCAEFARRRIALGLSGMIVSLIDTTESSRSSAEASAAAGVINLVKTLGAEWARDGIRVNGLSSPRFGAPDWSAREAESLSAMALYLCSPYAGFAACGVTAVG